MVGGAVRSNATEYRPLDRLFQIAARRGRRDRSANINIAAVHTDISHDLTQRDRAAVGHRPATAGGGPACSARQMGPRWFEHRRFGRGRGKVCCGRIFLLAADPGEGRFTEPTAAAQAWPPELVFMPHLRPSCPLQRLVVSPRKRSFASDFWSFWRTASCQFGEQRFGILQVSGVEALGEPGVDWGEQVAGFGSRRQ